MKSSLAFDLLLIALEGTFIESRLYEAANHPMCTKNDEQMLYRYWNGLQNSTDHIRLQELANKIERYESEK